MNQTTAKAVIEQHRAEVRARRRRELRENGALSALNAIITRNDLMLSRKHVEDIANAAVCYGAAYADAILAAEDAEE